MMDLYETMSDVKYQQVEAIDADSADFRKEWHTMPKLYGARPEWKQVPVKEEDIVVGAFAYIHTAFNQ